MLCVLFGFVLTTAGWAAMAYWAFRRLCLRLKDNPHAVQALTAQLRLALLGKEPAGDAPPPANPESNAEAKKIKGTFV
jgi:hypothetical protein